MSNETPAAATTAVQKVSVINALATKLECDPQKLAPMLKKTAFATCRTDEEFMAMCMVANTYGLNPILKEVYAFPAKGGQVVPIVSVDGWIKLMNSHPAFDGIEFEEDKDKCTAIIYRKDRAHPIKATEWLGECVGSTEPWKRWPRRMLRHKALIQAARIAFGFAGIYDEDEGRRIAEVGDVINITETEPQTASAPVTSTDKLRSVMGIDKPKAEIPANSDATSVSSSGGINTHTKAKDAAKPAPEAAGAIPDDLPL